METCNSVLIIKEAVLEYQNAQKKIEDLYAPKTEKIIILVLLLLAMGLFFCHNLTTGFFALIFSVLLIIFVFYPFNPRVDEIKIFRIISRKIWRKNIQKEVKIIQKKAFGKLFKKESFIWAMTDIKEWEKIGREAQHILLEEKRKHKEKEVLTGYNKG